MITAYIQQNALDVANDISFERVRQSQLFSFDKLRGDVVPSISFPNTERNRNVLDHPNRYELDRTGVKEYDGFELRYKGDILIRGTLVLTDGFNGYVRGMVGVLAQTQKDKLITDHALPSGQAFVNKTNYDPATDDYCCPQISNNVFFDGVGIIKEYTRNDGSIYSETILQRMHRNVSYRVNYPDAAGVLINNLDFDFEGQDVDSTYNLTVVSPMLFLNYTFEKLLALNGFWLKSFPFSSAHDLMKLCIYNNVDINDGEAASTTAIALQELRDEDVWVDTSYKILTVSRNISTFNYADVLPKVTLKEWLIGWQNFANVFFDFKNDYSVELVDREARLLASPSMDLDAYFVSEWEMGTKKDIALKFVQKHDSSDVFFGDYYEDLSDRANDFGDDVADFATLQATTGAKYGELRRVLSEGKIYEWVFTVIPDTDSEDEVDIHADCWKFISVDYQPLLYNYSEEKEVEEIATCFSTCLGSDMPQFRQPGQSNLRTKDKAPFTPRLLFYEGNGVGKNNTDLYSLKFTGENNMFDKRWKKTAAWYSTREPAAGYLKAPMNILKAIDVNEKQKTRHGNFIIDKMTTTFTHAGPGLTKMDVFKE